MSIIRKFSILSFVFLLICLSSYAAPKPSDSKKPSEADLKDKIKREKIHIKTLFVAEVKFLTGALRAKKISEDDCSRLCTEFRFLKGNKYVEVATKTKREWFIRMHKGLLLLEPVIQKLEYLEKEGIKRKAKGEKLSRGQLNLKDKLENDNIRIIKQLKSVMVLRKKKYAIKKKK